MAAMRQAMRHRGSGSHGFRSHSRCTDKASVHTARFSQKNRSFRAGAAAATVLLLALVASTAAAFSSTGIHGSPSPPYARSTSPTSTSCSPSFFRTRFCPAQQYRRPRPTSRVFLGDSQHAVRRSNMFMMVAGGVGVAGRAEGGQREEDSLWLGLDLSTQSLTAAVLRGSGTGGGSNQPVLLQSVNYEKDLPAEQRYGSKNGMKVVGSQITSPVAMWLHALEALLQRLKDPEGELAAMGLDLSAVRGVSVSGQQHGTVYWAKGAGQKLEAMTAPADAPGATASTPGGDDAEQAWGGEDLGLAEAFAGCFAVEDSPIWADGSTEQYASELEAKMGGAARLAELTGSRAHLRQGAPQIMKIHRERPEAYENTERISLVCSFLASVLAGRYAEIETSDGSGMNLMHIREKRWVEEALTATAPDLRGRLGGDDAIVDSHVTVGNVSGYLCRRFGFSGDCVVVAGSGDNCNSLAGMGVVSAGSNSDNDAAAAAAAAADSSGGGEAGVQGGGDVMVSLGTSDTLLGVTTDPSPTTTGNTMYHPCDPAAWFAMLVYKNGSLTREGVRNRRAGGDWKAFSALLRDGKPGNDGKLGLFLDLFEITPQLNRQGSFVVDGEDRPSSPEELSGREEARAVVEGRFLSMRAHARELGVGRPRRILATGGGSNNAEVLQVLADVFQAPVFTAAASDSAAVGAALRAKHGVACLQRGVSYFPFAEVYGDPSLGDPAAVPTPGSEDAYKGMVDRMDALEQRVLSMEMRSSEEDEEEEEGDVGERVALPPVPVG